MHSCLENSFARHHRLSRCHHHRHTSFQCLVLYRLISINQFLNTILQVIQHFRNISVESALIILYKSVLLARRLVSLFRISLFFFSLPSVCLCFQFCIITTGKRFYSTQIITTTSLKMWVVWPLTETTWRCTLLDHPATTRHSSRTWRPAWTAAHMLTRSPT